MSQLEQGKLYLKPEELSEIESTYLVGTISSILTFSDLLEQTAPANLNSKRMPCQVIVYFICFDIILTGP